MHEKLFAPFEIALQEFYVAGGAHVTAILSPTLEFQEFLRALPVGSMGPSYMDIPIELAPAQISVSIRGRTATGQIVEFPVPKE